MPYLLEQINDGSIADQNFRALARDMNPPVPQARVFNSAAIATVTGVLKILTFDSEHWDEGALHSTTVNTSRLTAPITGLYMVGAHVQWANNAVGERYVDLLVNGATAIALARQPPTGAGNAEQALTTSYRFAAGDYVELRVFQTSGGPLNVAAAGNYTPEFWMHRIGGYVNVGV